MSRTRAAKALLAVVLCAGAVPAAANAAEGPDLVSFIVPNQAAIDDLTKQGYDLTEYKNPQNNGSLEINVVVTDEQRAQLEAMGYRADHVIETAADGAAAAAHADASWAKQQTALANLTADQAQVKAAAATDTVLACRADYFENYAGRWISIEARPSDNSPVRANNPVMTAAWDSGPGTPLGGAGQEGILQAFIDTDPPDADYYLYHFNTFRVGALDDGKPMPSQVRVASANGGVDTIAVKRWTSKDGKGFPTQYVKDFTTDYVDPQQAYKKIRDLRAEFPNLADIIDLPNKTTGYQRKAQTVVGLATPYAGATGNLDRARRPGRRAHLEGLGPGRRQRHHRPAEDRRPRWASRWQARRSRSTSPRTSTAAQVVDASTPRRTPRRSSPPPSTAPTRAPGSWPRAPRRRSATT